MRLHVLGGGAAKGLVLGLQAGLLAQVGTTLDGTFSAVNAIAQQLVDGAPCDVVILTAGLIDALTVSGHVVKGSAAPLGRVGTGVAVRSPERAPDIGDGPSLATALVAAAAIYIPDPVQSTAGLHFASVLRRLGIDAAVAPSLRPFANGATAMAALAQAHEHPALGCTQVTEILYTPGVTLAALLPPPFGLSTLYVAAVATHAAHPAPARQLVELLSGDAAQALRIAGGFGA